MEFVFVFSNEDYGTFQPEHSDDGGCSFVLTKGTRSGQICNKPTVYSSILGDDIPACSAHATKYEDGLMTAYAQQYYEQYINNTTTSSTSTTTTTKKQEQINLEKIPKAIDRELECTVCRESVDPLLLPCGHTTCYSCVCCLTKKECPMCRSEFKNDQLRRL